MDVKIATDKFYEVTADTLVVPVYEDEAPNEGLLKELNERTDGTVGSLLERREFRGKSNELAYIHSASGLKSRRLLLVGLGKEEKFNHNRVREAAGTTVRALKGKKMRTVAFLSRFKTDAESSAQALVEGLHLGLFEPDSYKTKEQDNPIFEEFVIVAEADTRSAMEKGAKAGKILGESVNFARELINEPSSHLTPINMAERAQQVASRFCPFFHR